MYFDEFFLPELQKMRARQNHTCPVCGISEAEVARTGRVGCAECYREFEALLAPYIRRIHGVSAHAGRVPARVAESPERRRLALEREMKEAIAAQNFERAAEIRDELRAMEGDGRDE